MQRYIFKNVNSFPKQWKYLNSRSSCITNVAKLKNIGFTTLFTRNTRNTKKWVACKFLSCKMAWLTVTSSKSTNASSPMCLSQTRSRFYLRAWSVFEIGSVLLTIIESPGNNFYFSIKSYCSWKKRTHVLKE